MPDKELEAMIKCYEHVNELDDPAKVRVIKYLIDRFEIVPPVTNGKSAENANTNGQDAKPALLKDGHSHIEDVTEVNENDFPSLNDVMVRNFAKNEVEWVLVYAFYASSFGKTTFSRESIRAQYDVNKRWSDATSKNFSANINSCIKKDYFKSTTDSLYILKETGKSYVNQILQGNSTTKEAKRPKKYNKASEPKLTDSVN